MSAAPLASNRPSARVTPFPAGARVAADVPSALTPLGDRALVAGDGDTVLSAREVEVLRLLVEGLPDQEIAALFIARRTASKHVSSILDKLDVPTRSAAVSYAVRHRLV